MFVADMKDLKERGRWLLHMKRKVGWRLYSDMGDEQNVNTCDYEHAWRNTTIRKERELRAREMEPEY